jgi:hypothetical protein
LSGSGRAIPFGPQRAEIADCPKRPKVWEGELTLIQKAPSKWGKRIELQRMNNKGAMVIFM